MYKHSKTYVLLPTNAPDEKYQEVKVSGYGNVPSRILIVGDVPGESDLTKGRPFSGESGKELTKMLHEAGIVVGDCFMTNVCKYRPASGDSDNLFSDLKTKTAGEKLQSGIADLREEIIRVNPNVIITLGNLPLWVLTGHDSVESWRGSVLETVETFKGRRVKLIPTYHPTYVQRVWESRPIVITDLRRAAGQSGFPEYITPNYNFAVPQTANSVLEELDKLFARLATSIRVSCDIETIRHQIACIGFAWSKTDALCIPIRTSREYWTLDEEVAIILSLRKILSHPNCRIVGQNFAYDAQYICRKWGISPNLVDDTLIQMHVAFAGMPKDLAFLSSLFCDFHVYWKDDLKDYKSAPTDDMQFFTYNCTDCVRTWEIAEALDRVIDSLNLREVYLFQIRRMWPVLLNVMLRGVRIDNKVRGSLTEQMLDASEQRRHFIEQVVGYDLNPKSPKQMFNFLYNELGLPFVKNRKTKKPTANFDALMQLCEKLPILYPLADALIEQRSIGQCLAVLSSKRIDPDGRMRTSYNLGGTDTYRLSSSENAFGSGTNLQNISAGKAKTRFRMPNMKTLFVPEPGKTIADCDLDRADLQVVVWEADDKDLKEALRRGIDMHCFNAVSIFDLKGIPPDELMESHPNYKDHRGRIGEFRRQQAKAGVHAVDYYCQARTLAGVLGITVHAAQRFIDGWFAAHPGIAKWHDRVEHQLQTRRYVTNRFGYRRFYAGRIDALMPEALAWVPQSTVAITINRGIVACEENIPQWELLLQVHDSVTFQYPTILEEPILRDAHKHLLVTIPYDDPLVIPIGLKTSTQSWGAVKERKWPQDLQQLHVG